MVFRRGNPPGPVANSRRRAAPRRELLSPLGAAQRRSRKRGGPRAEAKLRACKRNPPKSGILSIRRFLTTAESGLGSRPTPQPDMEPLVLTVDLAGLPQAWVDLEEAITYHAKLMWRGRSAASSWNFAAVGSAAAS